MKRNAWTVALVGTGLLSLPGVMQAEEKASPVLTALSETTISGYVDTSAQWNIGTGNAYVPTYAFGGPGKADGFNLNVVKLSLEHPLAQTDGWSSGYKVDLLFGPDANAFATQSSGTAADFGIKQAYVALRAPVGNGLDFKMGVWDTVIGYEVFESPLNPNFTRSYGYTLEPTTHTGLLGSYQFCPAASVSVGVANTFGPKINERAFPDRAESYKAYLGSINLTAPDSWGFLAGSTLVGAVVNGFNANTNPQDGNGADQTSWYVGATLNTPVTGLKVGASYDYLAVNEQPISGPSYANATAVYASMKLTEKLTFFARGEYASGDTLVLGANGSPYNILGTTKVVAATATLQYDLWANVLSRLEFRWDHSANGQPAYGSEDYSTGPDKKNSYILMANVVYKF